MENYSFITSATIGQINAHVSGRSVLIQRTTYTLLNGSKYEILNSKNWIYFIWPMIFTTLRALKFHDLMFSSYILELSLKLKNALKEGSWNVGKLPEIISNSVTCNFGKIPFVWEISWNFLKFWKLLLHFATFSEILERSLKFWKPLKFLEVFWNTYYKVPWIFGKPLIFWKIPWNFRKSPEILWSFLKFSEGSWNFWKSSKIFERTVTFLEVRWSFLKTL